MASSISRWGARRPKRLGYAPADLDRIPAEAIEAFASVGFYFDLADLKEGETVIDFGSGSGMDTVTAFARAPPDVVPMGARRIG